MSKSNGWLPSYEESIDGFQDSEFNSNTSHGQRIIDQLTVVRLQHIRSIIEQHICPVVEENASIGIARTVLVLLPTDILKVEPQPSYSDMDSKASNSNVTLEGFSTDEDVRQVQLEGKMNQVGFWKQPRVVLDFQRALQERLSSLPQFQSHTPIPSSAPVAEPSKPAKLQKRGFFRRFAGSISEDIAKDEPGRIAESSTRATAERVRVEVGLEEICVRTVSDFGLYESINRQGVIVRINASL